MARGLVAHVLRGLFIVLMTSGGGELPALDALLFHSDRSVPVAGTSHLETAGSCHADQCAIRATAHHPPVTPTVAVTTLKSSDPGAIPSGATAVELLPALPASQPFSRAPPRLLF